MTRHENGRDSTACWGDGVHYLGPVQEERESAAANSKALEKDGQVTIIHKQMHYKVLTLCFWIINVNTMSDF